MLNFSVDLLITMESDSLNETLRIDATHHRITKGREQISKLSQGMIRINIDDTGIRE